MDWLASSKMRRKTDGSVRMVGPISKRKPSAANSAALPPSQELRSSKVTSCPRAASVQAAASPPSPLPITAVFCLLAILGLRWACSFIHFRCALAARTADQAREIAAASPHRDSFPESQTKGRHRAAMGPPGGAASVRVGE